MRLRYKKVVALNATSGHGPVEQPQHSPSHPPAAIQVEQPQHSPQPSTSSHSGSDERPVGAVREPEEAMENRDRDPEELPPDVTMADLTAGAGAQAQDPLGQQGIVLPMQPPDTHAPAGAGTLKALFPPLPHLAHREYSSSESWVPGDTVNTDGDPPTKATSTRGLSSSQNRSRTKYCRHRIESGYPRTSPHSKQRTQRSKWNMDLEFKTPPGVEKGPSG
ncbi:UNVERIFIED_CONTAM: hypothetical protein K2H54_026243 [Gekko kuhli]